MGAETRGSRWGSGFEHHRHDHGAAPVRAAHPTPDRAPDDLLQLVRVAYPVAYRELERLLQLWPDGVEHRVVLGEPPRLDLRAAHDLARRRVDDHDDRDEAFVTEDAPILELGVRDVADGRSVHVHIAAVDLAGDLGDAVDQVDD